ncbi:MAG: alpha/beta fold hydrolase [Burkholderiales bacterium]
MSPLLFLHGVGGGHAAWDRQLPYFTSRGYAARAWNQPGYGGAPIVEPYDLEQVSAALVREIGDEPAVLVGHSMGGFVALETSARHPECVRALALCFTSASFGGGSSDFARQFIAARIAPLDQGKTMAEIATKVIPAMRGTRSGAEGVALAERLMGSIPPDTYRKAVKLLTTFDRRAQLEHIRVPTLLVAGGDDRVAPADVMQRMAKRIPAAEFVQLEGCGHLGPMDQPEAFNAALAGFLDRHGL